MTTMADRDGFIWYDGELMPWRDANTHVLTYSLHYGVGVFEGVRAYATPKGTAVFRLEEHTKRLFNSAKILGMKIPFSPEQINEATLEVLRANKLKEAYIRPMVFYGSEGMGLRADNLKVHVIIAAWTWGAYLGADNVERGIRVKTSSYSRHHVNAALCRAKANANYLNSMLALNEALRDGYDEAVMLDPHGYIAEGSAENIFLVQDGRHLRAGRHHPPHGDAAGRRRRHQGGRAPPDARRAVHQRRGLLHRHRRRGDADPRGRQPLRRHRQARPDHREAAEGLRRAGQGRARRVPRVADPGQRAGRRGQEDGGGVRREKP